MNYRVFPISEIVNGTIVPPPFLFNGLMRHNTITLIAADPFTGKTMLMLDMLLCLDTHRPLLGIYEPTRQARSLFVGQDAPTWDYVEQLRKLIRGHGIKRDECSLLSSDIVPNEGIRVTDPVFMHWIREWKEKTNFEVLFLDTMIDVHGGNERNEREMADLFRILKRIREELGVAIIMSHHKKKPSADTMFGGAAHQTRGSSAIPGAVDFHFQLAAQSTGIRLTMAKGRGGSFGFKPVDFELRHTEADGIETVVLEALSNPELVAMFLSWLQHPKRRPELVSMLSKVKPELDKEQLDKAVDNTLQAMKRSKQVVQVSRGVWGLNED